ncbi:hypothetical protein DWF00_25070 [Bosea caraganae]|uniref:Uncharacterized protein n=1 Tax=Bosea caraganae TaxID=2763117 RepID=A0A370L0I4_9HYPH|nr:hypothetical protein [Bosea caraganae]RDJ20751.1 hypothetical protein DWE98_22555 [Bosea caraganae]RDJ21637.1 hypothetical protein DWF00_25070 [Bosea caraganae]
MPLTSRALAAALACLLTASTASAEITDPEMTCAAYLKGAAGARTHKAGHAAGRGDVEARIRAFCAANPKMKAMDAEMTITGD